MNKLLQYYQIISNLSLDVVLGVYCGLLPLPLCFGVPIPLAWYVALPAGTWAIYLADHWLDMRQNAALNQPRHVFIKQYQTEIAVLILLLVGFCAYTLVSFLHLTFWITAMVLASCSLLYFVLSHLLVRSFQYYYNKELVVACIYATALYLPIGLQQNQWLPWVAYFALQLLLAYVNLLMVSIIEMPADYRSKQFSWVQLIGAKRATRFFHVLTIVALVSAVALAATNSFALQQLALVYGVMALLHWIVFRYQHALQANESYRKLCELIFWLPAIIWLLA
ncbi:MAG: hypothetical protein MUE96_06865 [Bacteroidia bacterium]|nr:hypothetical protein [Bacteroidia bacterium]